MVNNNVEMNVMNTVANNTNMNGNVNTLVDINQCITANVIYIELGGVRFMVDLAILRLFPESILITMFPTGIPLVNIKQQYKSLTRLQQFFLKLAKENVRSVETYPFEVTDFTDENEYFINPNLSPMDEAYILYINFDPNLFEYLYQYFSIKFAKMQYLKFLEQYDIGGANNIDMTDIQQIKNLFYITISQQIILVLREEIEFFVIPAVNLQSAENCVEQTNSIVHLYNKDVCNLEFMHQLKNVCSQFLVDRRKVLVKLDNINEMEDITKVRLHLEELNKAREEKSSVSRFSLKGASKQKRNYPILNTLNILTKIHKNSTWGYRARESTKTKINSIAMLLVNLPINSLNPNYEFGMEEEEEEPYPNQSQPQPQPQPMAQATNPSDNNTTTNENNNNNNNNINNNNNEEDSYNNYNNHTNESLHNVTVEQSSLIADKTNPSVDKANPSTEKPSITVEMANTTNGNIKHEVSGDIIPEEVAEEIEEEEEVVEPEEKVSVRLDGDESYDIPPRPTLPNHPYGNKNRSFIVLNDMTDTSFDSRHSRVLHHSKSSNNLESGAYDNSELFESNTDFGDDSHVFKSSNTVGNYSRNSLPLPVLETQQILYHSCIDVDNSRFETDSFDSMENIENKLDIDNIDNIENKLEEIQMKCSDENSIILHSSIREIVRNPSRDEENLKIISYIQDEVSVLPHNDSVILNNTTMTGTNTSVTTDIINSSPLNSSDNEIIPMVVPSNDKQQIRASVGDVTIDENDIGHDSKVIHRKSATGPLLYTSGNDTDPAEQTEQTEGNASTTSYSTNEDITNEIVVPELSNMVTQVEPEPEFNQDAMNNTLSILQPCRNFWWESIALHLDLPKNKYHITENLKLDYSDIQFSNIEIDAMKEQDYNIDSVESTLDYIDLKLWLRRQWTVEFCAV